MFIEAQTSGTIDAILHTEIRGCKANPVFRNNISLTERVPTMLLILTESRVLSRLRVSPAPVPEPSSLVLLATGAIGLIGYRRRKQKLAA